MVYCENIAIKTETTQGRDDMKRRHPRHRPISILGYFLGGASAAALAAALGTPAGFAATPSDAAAACAKLATLTNFPVTPTEITLAKFNAGRTLTANGVALPD